MTTKRMERRVSTLERRQGVRQAGMHIIIPDEDETPGDARTRYEADHAIGPNDKVVSVRFVDPV